MFGGVESDMNFEEEEKERVRESQKEREREIRVEREEKEREEFKRIQQEIDEKKKEEKRKQQKTQKKKVGALKKVLKKPCPCIHVYIADVKVEALIDTGAEISILNPEQEGRELPGWTKKWFGK